METLLVNLITFIGLVFVLQASTRTVQQSISEEYNAEEKG